MGKTIIELFNSSKLVKQIPQSKPTTGYADNSEFLIDRKNRLGAMAEKMFDPKTETQLEQELSGLRPYRLVNEPALYGTQIVRIGTQKTPDLDAMKQSKTSTQVSLGKIGKFVQNAVNTVNKKLGIPQNVFPTYVINTKEFRESKTPNRMIALGNVLKDARGTALGRYLKSTGAGTPSQIAKQSIGQGINLGKGFVRNLLIGDKEVAVTSGSLDNFVINQNYYYSEGEYQGSYTYSMRNATTPDSKASYDLKVVSITSNGLDRSENGGVFGKPLRFANKSSYAFKLSDTEAHKKFGEPTQIQLLTTYNTPKKEGRNMGPYGTDGREIDKQIGGLLNSRTSLLNAIRPVSLNRDNWKKDRYSTNKNKKSYHGGGETISSDKLDKKRGLFSIKDVINQTGRFTEAELKTIKYNGKTIDQVDLIPLKFQKINDGSAVYFRSLVTGYSETFTPEWESSRMLGSPFNFYSYTSVERKLQFSLKVYAMSQVELVMMWRRLEYLAHCTYPYAYNKGIIEPTLLKFTFGNIHNNKACFLDSLTYTIEDAENLWEIGGKQIKIGDGRFEDSFNGQFLVGENNDKALSISKGIGGVYFEDTRNVISNNEIVTRNGNRIQSNIGQKPVIAAKVNTGAVNMDNYKLPKFINASIGLTFIESKSTTQNNIYGYGKK
jgi:hypothetical protein